MECRLACIFSLETMGDASSTYEDGQQEHGGPKKFNAMNFEREEFSCICSG